MSGYQLEATDGSGSHTFPAGQTVIGRGPLLGIADKRVSRSHAVLDLVDDQLRIKSTHVNPCFYQSSGKGTFVPLERNEWRWLRWGDCIALLPDKYSFRVITNNPSEEATLRNSHGLDEESELNGNLSPRSPVSSETRAASPPQHGPSSRTAANTGTNRRLCSKPSEDDVKPAQRKRVLPDWMLQGELSVQALPPPVVTTGKKKRTITQRNQTTPSRKSKDEAEPGKKPSEVSFPTTSTGLTRTATPTNVQKGCEIDSKEEDMEEECADYTPDLSPPPHANSCTSGNPSTSDNKPSISKVASNENISLSPESPEHLQQTQTKRVPCMYGEQCYRKNPVHFQEFSHPGDDDYCNVGDGSQDDEDDRPECPYGTDCYRKNPQHKLEYKHTKPPGRKLRKRNPKKAQRSVLDGDSDDDGVPNEYDDEDSFINDDSEEEDFDLTDEDSDWMPDSQDKDSEDVKDLLKEAKKFVRGKR